MTKKRKPSGKKADKNLPYKLDLIEVEIPRRFRTDPPPLTRKEFIAKVKERWAAEDKAARAPLRSKFNLLGLDDDKFNLLEAWTDSKADQFRVYEFLFVLHEGLIKAEALSRRQMRLYGQREYTGDPLARNENPQKAKRQAHPGELAYLKGLSKQLVDLIGKLQESVEGSDKHPTPKDSPVPGIGPTELDHLGLAIVLPDLLAVRDVIKAGNPELDYFPSSVFVPKPGKGRPPRLLKDARDKLGLRKQSNDSYIASALADLLVKMRDDDLPADKSLRRARKLARKLVTPVIEHADEIIQN